MNITNADKTDAAELAYLLNLAGEGLPEYLWSQLAQGQTPPLAVGTQRAGGEEGSFSYRNARVYSKKDKLMGMLIGYRLPDPYEIDSLDDCPAEIKPLLQLEAKAPGSWYINALATYPEHRGKGVARALMADAEQRAKAAGCPELSLIVASDNKAARTLYDDLGFENRATLPVIPYPGCLHGGDWILMVKRH